MGKRVLLYPGCEVAQLFPLRNAMCFAVALESQIPQPLVMEFLMRFRCNELGRRLGMIDALHARSPLRI